MGFAGLADGVILAWGWRRRLIALAAGASGALALPPLDLWPLIVVPMTAAIWLIDGAVGTGTAARFRAAAAAGWWWGFGFFLAGLWWLGAAFLVEADKFAWAMPLGVVALPALLAFFPALAFGCARLLWPSGTGRILILAIMLSLSEWLRGHVLTGFPWNVYGMMLAGQPHIAQIASVIGLYGLTLLSVAIGAAPATLGTAERPRARWQAPVMALVALAGLIGFGLWRVPADAVPLVAGVKLRLMQPNLPQDAKFNARNGEAILNQYLALSDRATSPATPGVQAVTHLIWPESAFPFLLGRTPQALSRIGALLPPGTTLITGAARAGETLPGESRPPIFNAIQVVDDEGAIVSSYDKVHLVPFGEYLPAVLERLIRSVGLSEFVSVPGGFAAGTRRLPLAIRGLPPAAPLICYEVVFPAEVAPQGPRPGFMLNLTNDGWFGRTSGPYQHFAQARLRAIEEGLPLVRVANTGISAVTDGYGRVLGSLPLGSEGVLDMGLPRAGPATSYSRFGDLIYAAMLAGFLLLSRSLRRH
ncbi:MAG: apolipoprotein N-acyltransferase [Bosea sp. (in: a-proteobacteria)]|uniref:apolipoprotein N-acyltransferase n=1 Tax=Bosea sp. (in: a-proteobacteria) TaxID=1871050 RepID=UPI002736AED0|nr:apolipoprotein N-acyltransferase [Bosea sp. (in: a-proteobacteria)]MDP3258797.1 apolipoprotein N-acyltransferase [Bosea sp. (in: a-proteobacteria)]MDP3320405.1 apolipoprotein N-acyltransferase [Bosea sp. (in: a-proteobacteria)]